MYAIRSYYVSDFLKAQLLKIFFADFIGHLDDADLAAHLALAGRNVFDLGTPVELLELPGVAVVVAVRYADVLQYAQAGYLAARGEQVEQLRITSYNVCYTKLLR